MVAPISSLFLHCCTVGASAAGYFLAKQLFDLDYTFDPLVWVIGLVSGALLVGISGTLATRSVGFPDGIKCGFFRTAFDYRRAVARA